MGGGETLAARSSQEQQLLIVAMTILRTHTLSAPLLMTEHLSPVEARAPWILYSMDN